MSSWHILDDIALVLCPRTANTKDRTKVPSPPPSILAEREPRRLSYSGQWAVCPVVYALADVLRAVLEDGNNLNREAAQLVGSDDAVAWAVEIARYVPATVRRRFVSGMPPDLTHWIDPQDVGVY